MRSRSYELPNATERPSPRPVLLALGIVTLLGRTVQLALPGRDAAGALLCAAGLYLLYLQFGFLIGYPFGIRAITLPLQV